MMATHTRSLPTDSPIPFLPIERRHMSEGFLENIPPYGIPSDYTINIGGIDYHSEITEQIECQPLHVWMIVTPYSLLNMAEGH